MSYNDYPLDEIRPAVEKLAQEGNLIYQKWTCAFCGDRVTTNQPNALLLTGNHEECAVDPVGITDIGKQGCNYLVVQVNTMKGADALRDTFLGE